MQPRKKLGFVVADSGSLNVTRIGVSMRMSVAEPTGDTEPTVGGVTSMFVITLAVYAPPAVAAMVSRTSGSSLLLSGPPYHSGRKLVCAISWTRAKTDWIQLSSGPVNTLGISMIGSIATSPPSAA